MYTCGHMSVFVYMLDLILQSSQTGARKGLLQVGHVPQALGALGVALTHNFLSEAGGQSESHPKEFSQL